MKTGGCFLELVTCFVRFLFFTTKHLICDYQVNTWHLKNSNICRKKTHYWMVRTCSGNMFAVSLFSETLFKTFNLITKLIHNMNHNITKDKSFPLTLKYPKFHNVRRMLLTCKGWNVKIININNKNNPKKWNLKKFVQSTFCYSILIQLDLDLVFFTMKHFRLKRKFVKTFFVFIQVYEIVPVFLGLIHLSNIAQMLSQSHF